MRKADLERAARRLVQALGKDECLLVGGMAVAAHGYVRGTRDVDFVAKGPLAEARRRLADRGIATTLGRGDFSCLKGSLGPVPFDILPELVPLDWDSAVEIGLGRVRLKVVDLPGLLQLKLKAHGARDLMDAAVLVLLHPEHRARVEELAVAYRVADKMNIWLSDARLESEARAQRSRRRRARR